MNSAGAHWHALWISHLRLLFRTCWKCAEKTSQQDFQAPSQNLHHPQQTGPAADDDASTVAHTEVDADSGVGTDITAYADTEVDANAFDQTDSEVDADTFDYTDT